MYLERVCAWCKLDQLLGQKRSLCTAMTNGAGLLTLMLYQTIQHDSLTTNLRSSVVREPLWRLMS